MGPPHIQGTQQGGKYEAVFGGVLKQAGQAEVTVRDTGGTRIPSAPVQCGKNEGSNFMG